MGRARGEDRGVFEDPKGSDRWWACWYEGKRRRIKLVGRKLQAKAFAQKMRDEWRHGRLFPELTRARESRQLTVADLVDRYADEISLKANAPHMERYGRYWKKAAGGELVSQLRPEDMARYQARRRAEGKAPATINKEVKHLLALVNRAVRDGLLAVSPLKGVRPLPEENQRTRWLSAEEEERLRAVVPPAAWRIIVFAMKTGLRRSELGRLKRGDVDLVNGLVTVRKSKSRRLRHVDLSPQTVELLREVLAEHDLDHVWTNIRLKEKRPLNIHSFCNQAFQRWCQKAGVHDFVWHDLRHTFGSRLAMAGATVVSIKELMGHASITTTMRYMHLAPSRRKADVAMLDSHMSQSF